MNPTLRARVGAAALFAVGVVALTGCADGFSGKDEPTPSAVATADPTSIDTAAPSESAAESESEDLEITTMAAPAAMKCAEFAKLDEGMQVEVLRELGATASDEDVRTAARVMTITGCSVWPDMLVADVLAGETGP